MINPRCAAESALIFGKTGWIGNLLYQELTAQNVPVRFSEARLTDRAKIAQEIRDFRPSHVLNAAGVTGRPNIDWCEDHRLDVVRSNVLGCLTLADVCWEHGVHMTYFGTGCIYSSDYTTQNNTAGTGFTEEDPPNFDGSYYAKTKIMVEQLLREYPHVLILRIRMPIVADTEHPRNFITKIKTYPKVVNIPNSMTVLPELLPVALYLAQHQHTGVFNLTNPGAMSHNEILEMYRDRVDPSFTWENFSLEEQAQVVKAPRSNNVLDVSKLCAVYPHPILPLRASLEKYVFPPKT